VILLYSNIATDYGLKMTGPGVSRTALGPTQPLIQWVTGALSWGVKRPGREAEY